MTADQAVAAIIAAVPRQPAVRLALRDAIGHVVADDVITCVALPPWTNSAMDGYAVRGADVRGASRGSPRQLLVTDVVVAGDLADRSVHPGEAMRIYTGARVPAGADCVIRQEDTDRGSDLVAITNDRDAGSNVRAAGGDLARGAVALARGSVIGPHQLALLAAIAETDPVVHRRPRVGVLTMGNELVAVDHREDILAGRKLADVNAPALAALVEAAGGVSVPLGIAPDDVDALHAMVEAAADIDLLITAGGASVGDHDHVHEVMQRLDVETLFDRVRMRPGGPTTFGLLPDGRPWLALPGNPVSAMVTFDLFGRSAIRAMAGDPSPLRRRFRAQLADDVRRDAVLDQYVRCTFAWPPDGGLPTARLTGPQGSGMLMSMVRAGGLAIVSHGEGMCAAGAEVEGVEFGGDC